MKARFILKWLTGADGQQEAKAPRDPDGRTSGDELTDSVPAGDAVTADGRWD